MSLRVNHNISAVNAHRNLQNNSNIQGKNLERLSSGMKINRGADGPAKLVISERLRAQTSGLDQAIDNSETGISLMQTAEGALDEVSRALIGARQLAVHAANEAVNDPFMMQADQQEIDNILATVNRISSNTQYGKNNLLDGSKGSNGVTTGDNLEFVSAGQDTKTSGPGGYSIDITQAATRSVVQGTKALNQATIDNGEQITITEGAKTVNFTTLKGETVETNLNALETAVKDAGLNLDMIRPPQGETDAKTPQLISFRHKEYGSEHSFSVASTSAGILSKGANVSDNIKNGLDVDGEINGEEASGRGQVLTGSLGDTNTDGLSIRYTGDKANAPGTTAGTVTVAQNSLVFQIGANADQTTSLSMRNMKTNSLGRGVANDSDFSSLEQVSVLDASKAQDSIRVLDRALEEVSATRAEFGAFQKNNLESNLNYLRIAHENVMSSESVLRDADMAEEMTQFTKNQIMMQSSTAMLAQANQRPQNVLSLLG